MGAIDGDRSRRNPQRTSKAGIQICPENPEKQRG
jgi:hypothetical protein